MLKEHTVILQKKFEEGRGSIALWHQGMNTMTSQKLQTVPLVTTHTAFFFPSWKKKKKRYIFKKKATFGTEVGGDSAIRIFREHFFYH